MLIEEVFYGFDVRLLNQFSDALLEQGNSVDLVRHGPLERLLEHSHFQVVASFHIVQLGHTSCFDLSNLLFEGLEEFLS